MPRKGHIAKREVAADPVYNSTLVTKFVNSMMWDGKKSTAQTIFYTAMTNLEQRGGDEALEALQEGSGELQAIARSEDATRGRRQLPGSDRSQS